MGKINNSKQRLAKEEDGLKVGTVLFTAGEANHADVWDDSELIDHWDRTIEVWRKRYSSENQVHDTEPKPLQMKQRENTKIPRVPAISKSYQNLPRSKPAKSSSIPKYQQQPNGSMPPMLNRDDVSNLMMAWYYCGYYTGLYQARKN